MNYFAHGMRYTDRPYFLAGTAIPDWLSVVDRKVRVRGQHVKPLADGSGEAAAELAAGVLQHLDDDQWFHNSAAFYETSGELTRLFRERLAGEDGYRSGFLGHIVTELLLDGVLVERNPLLLDAYYDALLSIDPAIIEQSVNRMARKSTSRLAALIPRFIDEQFLRDYSDPPRLAFRLNQVLRRIKLKQLPDDFTDVLSVAQVIVTERADQLMPASG